MPISTRLHNSAGRARGRWILAATILGSSMAFIDGTVVNVAMPALQRGLGASIVDVQWVIEAYALCLAALLLPGGALGDRFGRRRVFAIGVASFAGASLVCGAAPTVRALVAARAVQGIAAALLVPGSLAILSASFSREERGRAIGTWSAFTSITAALGPVLGGWLVDHLSWRWAFFVNAPLAVAVLAITFGRVPESRGDASGPLDLAGAALAIGGLGGVVYGLVESSELSWRDLRVLLGLAGGVAALAAFVIVERRATAPMMPPALFRSRNFAGANLLTLLLYTALSGVFFFAPLDLIQVQGYTAAAAGAAIMPFILLMFLLSRWSGGLVERVGPTWPLVVGPLVAAVGLFLFVRTGIGGSYWTTFFPAVAILGLGMAVTVAPLTTTVMSSVESRHAGAASGVNNAVSRLAGVLAVAVLSIVMLSAFSRRLDTAAPAAGLSASTRAAIAAQRTRLAAIELPATVPAEERARAKGMVAEAFVAGFRKVMAISAGLSVLASGVAAAMIRRAAR